MPGEPHIMQSTAARSDEANVSCISEYVIDATVVDVIAGQADVELGTQCFAADATG